MFSILQRKDFHYLLVIAKNYLLFYVLLSLIRAIFYVYNQGAFVGISGSELCTVFLAGLRFDSVSMGYAHALFLLWHLLPFNWRNTNIHKGIGTALWMGFGIGLLYLEFSDVVYFPYSNRRITKSDLDMQQDIINMLPQYLAEFWWMFLLVTIFSILLFIWYRKTRKTELPFEKSSRYYIVHSIIFVLGIGINIIAMRGGLQLRPLNAVGAIQYVSNVRYTPLVSNSMINLIHSYGKSSLQIPSYFTKEELSKYKTSFFYKGDSVASPKNYNVIYLIVESYGKEFIHFFNKDLPNITPFTDSILQEGYLFTQAHANGLRSAQGIAAATAGIPILMQDPIMFSPYSQNHIMGLPNYLKKIGYSTAFYHGGHNGTMNFDKFTKTIGFDTYFGKTEYDKLYPDSISVHFDGDWGVWDKPLLAEAIKQIGKQKQPFFATYFTLSPHHPYKTPNDYIVKDENHINIHRSINYTDEALRLFFEEAKKQDWYENTLFILAGDHMNPPQDLAYNNRAARHQMPIWFYHPTDTTLQKKTNNKLAQQIDVIPTLLKLLNYPHDFSTFGQDLLAENSIDNYAYTFDTGIFQIMDENYILLYDGNAVVGLYNYKEDRDLKNNIQGQKPEITEKLLIQLKAYIQAHHTAMIKNQLPQ